jgi:hypothetical protein
METSMLTTLAMAIALSVLRPVLAPDPSGFSFPDRFTGGFAQTETFPGETLGGHSLTTIDVTGSGLVWTQVVDPDALPPLPVDGRPGIAIVEYRLVAGSIAVTYHAETSDYAGKCSSKGSNTFSVVTLPPAALHDFVLFVHEDGRYVLSLSMRGEFLDLTAATTCHIVNRTLTHTDREHGIAIMLARRTQRSMAAQAADFSWVIAGETDTRVPAPATLVGRWNFTTAARR